MNPRLRQWRKSASAFLGGGVVGAAATYLLDRSAGRRRRHALVDRGAATVRRGARRTTRGLRAAALQGEGRAKGFAHRISPGPTPELDDAELVHKVESTVFRDRRIPKGQISMNAEHGCVVLRGQVDAPELVAELEQAVRKVRGVRDVENLLHVPGTPAPARRARGSRR